jgi:hypothetical protein
MQQGAKAGWPAAPQAGQAAAGAAAPGADPNQQAMDEINKLYGDLQKRQEAGWADTEAGLDAQNAALGRRAQAISGAMGRSVAGGFAGAMGQAALTGQQNYLAARGQYNAELDKTQKGWLDARLGQMDLKSRQDFEREMMGAKLRAEGGGGENFQLPDGSVVNTLDDGVQTIRDKDGNTTKIVSGDKTYVQDQNGNWYEETAQTKEDTKAADAANAAMKARQQAFADEFYRRTGGRLSPEKIAKLTEEDLAREGF